MEFFKSREKFLIVEILPGNRAHGLFLGVDEDRNLRFEKFLRHADLRKLVASPARKIEEKKWEGKHLFDKRRRVIAVADPLIATTIPVPMELERALHLQAGKITLLELEDLIAQAMKKIFGGCRAEAAKRIGSEEINTVLVGSRVEGERVDGISVKDVTGHAGKKIAFILEFTFTRRNVFESLTELFSSPEGFYFAESPQAFLRVVSAVRPLPVNLITAQEGQLPSSLFVLQKSGGKGSHDGYPVLYREPFHWHFDSLFGDIAAAFGVNREVAAELYRVYAKKKMSENVLKYFKRIIDPAAERLLAEVERAKISGPVYMDAPYVLPFALPYRHQGALFEPAPIEELLKKFGFAAEFDRNILPPAAALRYLAPFFEAYFDKSRSEINQRLRKKLHWLAE